MNTATDQWLWYRVTRACKLPFASTTWWLWQADVYDSMPMETWLHSGHDVGCRCMGYELPTSMRWLRSEAGA